MPYEGQLSQTGPEVKLSSAANEGTKAAPVTTASAKANATGVTAKTVVVTERKKVSQPGLKIVTGNLGIKSILDPPKNKQIENAEALLPDLAEGFTHAELMAVWNSYALDLKREKKDNLYATLTGSNPLLTSDYQVTLEISNSAQAIDLEREKVSLLAYLRSQLKNYQIGFTYKISETKKFSNTDTKSTFEKLADENPSLHKFRKLFNLDIDF